MNSRWLHIFLVSAAAGAGVALLCAGFDFSGGTPGTRTGWGFALRLDATQFGAGTFFLTWAGLAAREWRLRGKAAALPGQ